MDYPFIVGFAVLAIVFAIGLTVERFRSWAQPAVALITLAAIAAACVQLLL